MVAKTVSLSFNAGPLPVPSIELIPGNPSLMTEHEERVCLPQAAQMPETIHGDSLLPFLRRLGESCLFVAKAKPPVLSQLSDLLLKDNTGPLQGRLKFNGRGPSEAR